VTTTIQNLVLPWIVVCSESAARMLLKTLNPAYCRQIGEQPDEDRADVAELGPRLDHLRQPELWPLRGVRRHEEGAEQHPDDDRDEAPDQVAARADAHHPDGESGDLRVAHEPERAEVPELAVALGERHVVDGPDLRSAAGRFPSVSAVLGAHPLSVP
jgi:hypothetical protein